MSKVIACIDGSSASDSVCDYGAWVASRLEAPLTLLSRYPVENDFSGNLGVDAREHLLSELAELDTRRNKLALEQGELMLEEARLRAVAGGVAEPVLRQRHGHLIETLSELENDTQLLVIGTVMALMSVTTSSAWCAPCTDQFLLLKASSKYHRW